MLRNMLAVATATSVVFGCSGKEILDKKAKRDDSKTEQPAGEQPETGTTPDQPPASDPADNETPENPDPATTPEPDAGGEEDGILTADDLAPVEADKIPQADVGKELKEKAIFNLRTAYLLADCLGDAMKKFGVVKATKTRLEKIVNAKGLECDKSKLDWQWIQIQDCPGSDFTKFDGMTWDEFGKVANQAACVGSAGKELDQQKYVWTATTELSNGQKMQKVTTMILSTATAEGKVCDFTIKDNLKHIADHCEYVEKHSEVLNGAEKKKYFLAKFKDVKANNSGAFESGIFDVTLHDWKGPVTIEPANKYKYDLTNGTEQAAGSF